MKNVILSVILLMFGLSLAAQSVGDLNWLTDKMIFEKPTLLKSSYKGAFWEGLPHGHWTISSVWYGESADISFYKGKAVGVWTIKSQLRPQKEKYEFKDGYLIKNEHDETFAYSDEEWTEMLRESKGERRFPPLLYLDEYMTGDSFKSMLDQYPKNASQEFKNFAWMEYELEKHKVNP